MDNPKLTVLKIRRFDSFINYLFHSKEYVNTIKMSMFFLYWLQCFSSLLTNSSLRDHTGNWLGRRMMLKSLYSSNLPIFNTTKAMRKTQGAQPPGSRVSASFCILLSSTGSIMPCHHPAHHKTMRILYNQINEHWTGKCEALDPKKAAVL